MRKISYGEGVERVFPLYSPRIEKIEVVRRGAGDAKLYYLRSRRGKSARIAEKADCRFSAVTVGKADAPATAIEALEMKDEAMEQATSIIEEVAVSEEAAGDVAAKETDGMEKRIISVLAAGAVEGE